MPEREPHGGPPPPPLIPGEPFALDFDWEVTTEGGWIVIFEVKGEGGQKDLRLGFTPDQAKALAQALLSRASSTSPAP